MISIKYETGYNVQIWVGTLNKDNGIISDISHIEFICQKYVDEIGLCVTVTPTKFIYTNGNEYGACIGLINYPRFPSTQNDIKIKAIKLAKILLVECGQNRITITTPEESIMLTNE